jgi:pimeloyl-ACP methyl ester carboxylesterase
MKYIFATIVAVGLFGFINLGSASELPVTVCDAIQHQTQHLMVDAAKESGNSVFSYGYADQQFVSQAGSETIFNFSLLFSNNQETVIKMYFMDSNCTIGAGYAFQQIFPARNTFSFNSSSDNLIINAGEPIRIVLNVPVRYIWLEVADSVHATYSYAVDIQNIANPEVSEEEEPVDQEVRLTPDPVIIIPGILGSQEKNGVWLMDPILHTYTDLIETFRANGYQEDYDLFPFPYDWRRSNEETAVALRLRIMEAKNICRCDKVDVIAHSMGGLVVRQYIQSDDYAGDIDQLVFLGTPHLGAPKAYLIWEAGEVGESLGDRVLKFMLTHEGKKQGYEDFLSYVHAKIPSVSELLPIFDYLRGGEQPFNQFLENINHNLAELYNSQVDITNIIGELEGDSTIRYIDAEDLSLERGLGDGTVPQISSSYVNQNVKTINGAGHSKLPTITVSEVFRILADREPEEVSDEFNFPDIELLIIKMLSPADMMIIAPDGKRIGKDFQTNQEINEIEGAFYSGFIGDDEYITILNPLEGTYKITTKGTGTGEYTVATALFAENQVVQSEIISNTEVGKEEIIELSIPDNLQNITLAKQVPSSKGGGEVGVIGEVRGALVNKIREGTLVLDSSDHQTVYIISEGKKHGFVSAEVFLGMGFSFDQVILQDLASHEPDKVISSSTEAHPPGSVVWDGETLWLMRTASRLGFVTLDQYLQEGFSLDQVVRINKADLSLKEEVYAN